MAENYEKYNSFEEYFDAYKKNCLWEASENLPEKVERETQRRLNADVPMTLKGEIVKSVGEARIANFLYKNNIDYDFKDDVGTKITIRNAKNISIDGMSIHKSKGLTTDDVILIGLNNNFPIDDYGDYWLKDLFKNEVVNEMIDNAEERRVFYVALTRAKHKVYLLVNKEFNRVSPFVQELREIIRDQSG